MVLIIAWFVAPLFAPMYRLLYVDFMKESIRSGIPVEELKKEYEVVVFYNPRGNDDRDPAGWSIMDTVPDWFESSTDAWKKEDELDVAVRCKLISDRTGKPPSTVFIGSFPRDRYYKCKVWRFKPGALEQESPRPVILFQADTWEKLDRGIVFGYNAGGRIFEDIDEITDEYDDYWLPPDAEEEFEEEFPEEAEPAPVESTDESTAPEKPAVP